MVNEVSLNAQGWQNISQLQQFGQTQKVPPKPPSDEELFNKISQYVGADENGITKDQLQSYLEKLQADESEDSSRKAGLISKMLENFDELSGGADSITLDSFKEGADSIKPGGNGAPPFGPPPQSPSEVTSDQLKSPIDLRIG